MCNLSENIWESGWNDGLREGRTSGWNDGRVSGLNDGLKQGRISGLKEGKMNTLRELVVENLLTLSAAAKKANMTVEEFKAVMKL